jgi:hypothetical protein
VPLVRFQRCPQRGSPRRAGTRQTEPPRLFRRAPLPWSGDCLIQDPNRCGFHVSRREFESCPVGRIDEPSEEPLLARPDRMPVLSHHPNCSLQYLGRSLAWSCLHPASQGIQSPAIPGRFSRPLRFHSCRRRPDRGSIHPLSPEIVLRSQHGDQEGRNLADLPSSCALRTVDSVVRGSVWQADTA